MIHILLYLLSFLCTIPIIIWLAIYFHPARPWDFLPIGESTDSGPAPETWPDVCILVPARNESESLPDTLPHLLAQDYPGKFSVMLVDDRSSDDTAEVAKRLSAEAPQPDRLTIIKGKDLPDGWVGKVWAMEQGARAAGVLTENTESVSEANDSASSISDSTSKYVLLTDADILHAPGSLRRLVTESESGRLALNSRMARLRCRSFAEHLLIPPFVFFFNLLYPMRTVNDPQNKMAAAAGGCVLLSSAALRKAGGFACIKNDLIDDVNLARQIKQLGEPIRLSLSQQEVESLRAYDTLSSIWKMVRRTAFTELKYSFPRLALSLLGILFLFGLPPLAVISGLGLMGWSSLNPGGPLLWGGILALKGLLSWAIMSAVYQPGVQFFKLPRIWMVTLPLAGILYGGMTLDSALRYLTERQTGWR